MENFENICKICSELADVSHYLPCSHTFCYFCIALHLRSSNCCPVCFKRSFSKYDLKTNIKKYRTLEIPSAMLSLKEVFMKRTLKQYRISLDGTLSVITKRFMDLIDILYKEQFKAKMISTIEIAWIVNRSSKIKKKDMKINTKIIQSLLELKEMHFKLEK